MMHESLAFAVAALAIIVAAMAFNAAAALAGALYRWWRHPGRLCARDGHDWRFSGGRNAGCDIGNDCLCSVPVNICSRCGDCDYGDNQVAREIVQDCAMRGER